MQCECINWARVEISPYPWRGATGLPLVTNHHPNCKHYEDSLVDVWNVSDGSSTMVLTEEPDIKAEYGECAEDLTVSKSKMHLECVEQLGEHDGF